MLKNMKFNIKKKMQNLFLKLCHMFQGEPFKIRLIHRINRKYKLALHRGRLGYFKLLSTVSTIRSNVFP